MTLPAVLVAGGSGALGGAVVAALLEAGHTVTATYRRHPPADESQPAHSERLTWVATDLSDPDQVDTTVAGVADLGAVLNLAGGYTGGSPVHETSPDVFDHMIGLNLRPVYLLARRDARLVARGGGTFVAVSARAALRPFGGAAAYITAKAGVLGLVQALDAEYGKRGVRVNAIVPGVIDTHANRHERPDADTSGWVRPEAIAEVIAFLVSDRSAAISGAAIPV